MCSTAITSEVTRRGSFRGISRGRWSVPVRPWELMMSHEGIRKAIIAGCSEDELNAMRCPVCNGPVTFVVHPKRRSFFIRCNASNFHLAITGESASSPEWWGKYVMPNVWLS
jgi:hypothetical protein